MECGNIEKRSSATLVILFFAGSSICFSHAPDTLWTKTFGGTDNDYGNDLKQTSDGGYIIGGYIDPEGPAEAQFYLVEIDQQGNVIWESEYGGDGWDLGHAAVQTIDGGYAMTGWTDSYGTGGMDIWLVRLENPTAVEEPAVSTPDCIYLYGNYPNPFNFSTTVKFFLDKPEFVTLSVYDILGREVKTLFKGEKAAGIHRILFDASTLPGGVYFYSLKAGNAVETKRMALLK